MSTSERRTYNVGAYKIPHEDRDIAHAVLTEADDHGFYNILGAEDDPALGHTQPIGAKVAYRVELTDEEAERFRGAANCRYVELDVVYHDTAGSVAIPRAATMQFMRATFADVTKFHGRDVLIGMLDGGSNAACRAYIDATLVAKQTFGPDAPGADEITSEHGCLVLPTLVPIGGRFLDAIVSSNAGARPVSASVAAAIWCSDQGAKVINYSGSGASDSALWPDALNYMRDRNIQFFASAGNAGGATILFPASYSTTYVNVHSSISFDEATGKRSSFSNHAANGSGCAPGTDVLGLNPSGQPVNWSGTSASAPEMARLCAMGATGGKYTVQAVGAALKANTRDTGEPASEQGGGAYSLQAALAALGAFATSTPGTGPYRKTNRGPRLVMLTTAGVGRNGNRADGTGLSLGGAAGGQTTGVPERTQAAQLILDRITSGLSILDDWTWAGAPAIVGTHNDALGVLFTQENPGQSTSPATNATAITNWLRTYIADHGGSVSGGEVNSIAKLLKFGKGPGLAKFDIGIGFAPGDDRGPTGDGTNKVTTAIHRNYGLSLIEGGLLVPGYYELTTDKTAAKLSAHLNGGRTSANTEYPRVEWREYDIDGTTKMAFDPNTGTHYIIHKFRVMRMPPNKPELVVLQWHDAGDDVAMVRYRNKSTVEAKLGDTILGNLTGSAAMGNIYTAMIKIVGEGGSGASSGMVQAATAILERLVDDQPVAEDWTWSGAPTVVGQYNEQLVIMYRDETGGYNYPDDISSGKVSTWLRSFITKNSGGTSSGSGCRLEYYWQNMSTPVFTTSKSKRSLGWYGKMGDYAQSNSSKDAVEDGPFIVETLGVGHWHSVSPKSSSPWPEPLGLKP